VTKKFIQEAIKKPGALRKELGVKEGKTIPAEKIIEGCKRTRRDRQTRASCTNIKEV